MGDGVHELVVPVASALVSSVRLNAGRDHSASATSCARVEHCLKG